MKVTIIGTGYVGLVTGTCFAEMGHTVTCVDIDEKKVERMRAGQCPIYEPGLEPMMKSNIEEKRLTFDTKYDSVTKSQTIFLAVGTPSSDTGKAELKYLFSACDGIAPYLQDGSVVVVKSTVPVGTGLKVREYLKGKTTKKFSVVNNPEFLKEGSAVEDFMKPERIIIGASENEAAQIVEELYEPFNRQAKRTIRMSTGVGKTHPIGLGMTKMAQCAAEKSGGKMKVNLFLNNALGSDQAVVSAMKGGTVEMAVMNSGILASQVKDFGDKIASTPNFLWMVTDGNDRRTQVNAGRAYVVKSRIAGNVDFIFGNGRVVFDSSDIVSLDRSSPDNNGYIATPSTDVSTYGFLFLRSRLLKEHAAMAANSVALGRPWHPSADARAVGQAVFVECWMDDHITSAGWDRMSSTVTVGGERIWFEPSAARFYEYRSTGPGDAEDSGDDGSRTGEVGVEGGGSSLIGCVGKGAEFVMPTAK